MQVGAELEKFGTEQAKADDKPVADIYAKAGAKVLRPRRGDGRQKWQALARETAWKDYAAKIARLCSHPAAGREDACDQRFRPPAARPTAGTACSACCERGHAPGSTQAMLVPCMLALLAAAGILTYSVVARYFFKIPTDWQDEAAVFLLVGATFLSGAYRAVGARPHRHRGALAGCCRRR